jgi:nucleotide-binding universal stress UspA family protein
LTQPPDGSNADHYLALDAKHADVGSGKGRSCGLCVVTSGECILHDSLTAVRGAGVDADSRLVESLGAEAGECIIEQANSWPADLIVCGTHGRRGIRRIVMGSDAEYVLRHSPVPVLMVRAPGSPE